MAGLKSIHIGSIDLVINRQQVGPIHKEVMEHQPHLAIVRIARRFGIVQVPRVIIDHPLTGAQPNLPREPIPGL